MRRTGYDSVAACAQVTESSSYPGVAEWTDYFLHAQATDAQIVGMNVQVDARRARFQALHEQHQVVPAEDGAVIFGGVDLRQLLPERALPECQFLVVQIG